MKTTLPLLLLTGFLLAAPPANARIIPHVTLQELFEKADLVAVIQGESREKAADKLEQQGHEPEDFQAYNTQAKVLLLLKKPEDVAADLDSLTLLHFHYSERVMSVNNGALFISLPIQELEMEKRVLKDGNQIIKRSHGKWRPSYLAFLKRTDDGRYVPVMGQYDSKLSFKELDDPTLTGGLGRDLP